MKLKLTIPAILEDSSETEISLPAVYVVCLKCKGTGKHVNPSVDGDGLTAEDFAEDPDFAESYLCGTYDVTCERCVGKRVNLEVDFEKLTKAEFEHYKRWRDDEAAWGES